jgi:hypothetical protein
MKILFAILIFCLSSAAQAQIEFGIVAGYHSNQAETDIVGANIGPESGYQFGALTYLPLYKNFGMRTGFLYVQRFSTIDRTQAGQVDLDFAYFDVPLTAMLKFGDVAGIFAGPVLAFNQAKDVTCSARANCGASDVKSFILPMQIGLNVRMLSQLGAEVYYEFISGDLATNVSDMKTVGANLIFYFE